jgi:hypothetical protein
VIDGGRAGAETAIVSTGRLHAPGIRETYAAETVILVVILGLLDHVSPHDGLVAMAIVRFVCDEVCLSEELLLVVLEFSDHGCGFCRLPILKTG